MTPYKAGKLTILGVTDDRPLKEVPQAPTLVSKGYNVVLRMTRIIMAPREIPAERLKVLREAFSKLPKDKTFQGLMGRLGEPIIYMDGAEYEKEREKQRAQYKELVTKVTGK